ncbi:MAG: hypothetical protein K5657_05205 [Desulfovibrio sp.]|nr:hypothetical protein [Desulfovibrio sp.]
MEMSHESRIGSAILERIESLWDSWSALLSVKQITIGKIGYLAVWLPEDVEQDVEETWKVSASEGFLLNSLAQYLIMSTVQDLLPEVEDGGCAPSPRPTAALRETLAELGLPYKSETSSLLSLPYAVVTHFPFRGGCEICHLQDHCPKGQGKAEDASILLPGFERKEGE